MDKNIVNILKNKINKYEKILLFFHSRPDLDAICSCLAFKKFIQNFNHKIKIEIARVSQINSFQTNLDLPKLKNKPKHFTKNCLGIIFDTANEERIAGVEYKNCDDFIRIDHHPKTESFGSIEIIDPKYAATCELLAEIFFMWDKKNIDNEVAKYLYIGILTDTNRFFYPNTTPNTLDIASKLLNYKFDRDKIHNQLYLTNLNVVRFSNYLFSLAKFIGNKIAYIIVPTESFKRFNIVNKNSIIHVLSNIKELKIWLSIYYDNELKHWKGSIRSRNIKINKIAAKYNGGGHDFASGFVLKNINDFKKILSDVKKIV